MSKRHHTRTDNPDFSAFRIAFDHLTAKQGLDPKQVATLAIMFFVGVIDKDEGSDAAKACVLTALKHLGPPFYPAR